MFETTRSGDGPGRFDLDAQSVFATACKPSLVAGATMSLSAIITPAILDKVIGLLVPLLIDSAGGDLPTARHAATSLLADYEPQTEEELRLAAEIIGFGFGALDALSQSMAPDLTLNAILRLRGSANAQHRCANQCQRTLDKLRKERRLAEATVQLLAGEPASNDRTVTTDMDFLHRCWHPTIRQPRKPRH